MKYIISKGLFLLIVLFALSSCQRDIIPSGDTLNVEGEGLITLNTSGDLITINVQSSRSDWGYIKSAEWLKVTQNTESLALSASPNFSSQARTAELIVVAGKTQKKIVITQAASEAAISTSSASKEVDFTGGVVLFDITSNIPEWRAITDSDWISIRLLTHTSQIEVTVPRYDGRSPREAKIYIVGDNGEIGGELRVSQKTMPYHLLPFEGFLKGDLDVRNFEFSRGSSLTGVPDGFFNHYVWTFKTVSEAFSRVNYFLVVKEYLMCDVFATNPNLFQDLSELEDQRLFLRNNGFNEIKENVFYNPTKAMRASIIVGDDVDRVFYIYHPQQESAQPTVKSIPDDFKSFTSDVDDIHAWEATHGGTFNPSASSITTSQTGTSRYWFSVDGKDDIIARYYIVSNKTGIITEYAVLYQNIGRIYQTYQSNLYYTNEFLDLVEKKGFDAHRPFGNNKSKYSYKHYHPKDDYSMISRYIKYSALPVAVAELHFYNGN